MRSVCVYCGSNPGRDPSFAEQARAFARALVGQNLGLVYGGARNGLMGEIADCVLALGGEVRGVIPHALVQWEQAHPGLTELVEVDSMQARKQGMAERSDAFVALPGGIGTLEEIFEMISWAQLGVHHKPCAFLNVNGYYDKLIEFLDHSVDQGLMRPKTRDMILIDDDPQTLLERLRAYRSPVTHQWVQPDQT